MSFLFYCDLDIENLQVKIDITRMLALLEVCSVVCVLITTNILQNRLCKEMSYYKKRLRIERRFLKGQAYVRMSCLRLTVIQIISMKIIKSNRFGEDGHLPSRHFPLFKDLGLLFLLGHFGICPLPVYDLEKHCL